MTEDDGLRAAPVLIIDVDVHSLFLTTGDALTISVALAEMGNRVAACAYEPALFSAPSPKNIFDPRERIARSH